MDFSHLDQTLRESIADLRLDNEEKFELREIGSELDTERVRYLRNHAFDLARESMLADADHRLDALRWLEQVVRTLDVVGAAPEVLSRASFSPSDDCLRELRGLCRAARTSVDICVYTISDDRITTEIIACHARGVAVRLLSDNDKRFDTGNDIREIAAAGVPVRVDDSPHHMHHNFALFDGRLLANGSFNWTRSASQHNEENLTVTDDATLVRGFAGRFDQLWQRFAHSSVPADSRG